VTVVSTAAIPSQSLLDADSVKTAYFSDCYKIPLRDQAMPMPAIFFAIFGHHPLWVKALILTRNRAAAIFGLEVPTATSIFKPMQKSHYHVGENIGPWPIFELQENELIVGRNNSHLDFRLSLLKAQSYNGHDIMVSTICNVHNIYGKLSCHFINGA
jgi:Protein of unknown function (DUF2867)